MNDKIDKICSIYNCERKVYAIGFCKKHYNNFNRCGKPMGLKHECLAPGCLNIVYKDYCCLHVFRGRKNLSFDIALPRGNFKGGVAEYPNHCLMKKQRLVKLKQTPFCEECGKKATMIHHKDLSKDNHSLDNLMSVCGKCNMKPEFCKPRKTKYKDWFGATQEELADCFGLTGSTVSQRIKKGVPLDRPRYTH